MLICISFFFFFAVFYFRISLTSQGIHFIAGLLPGYVGADIEALCREAAMCALQRIQSLKLPSNEEMIQISQTDFIEASGIVRPSTQKGITNELSSTTTWDSIGGLSAIKKVGPTFPSQKQIFDQRF